MDQPGRTLLKELVDGLILRQATPADTDALVAFNSFIHAEAGQQGEDEPVGVWTRDLMARAHPTFDPGDFTLVEDTRTGAIVSSMNLISQTWAFDGIPLGVGRPELVGTHPDYRRQGLIRAQFAEIHRWSTARGHLVQAITGIPWYYRQFGYEMSLDQGGGRIGYPGHVTKLKDGETEPYSLRPATEDDIPFLARLYEESERLYPVTCLRDAALWVHEIGGSSQANINRREVRVIEALDGEPAGFLVHSPRLWGGRIAALKYEVRSGLSWLAVTPSVLRYLQITGEAYASQGDGGSFESFAFYMGSAHPVYRLIPDRLPRVQNPYAWYLRVPDLAAFIRHIAPALERRLAASLLVGHTGDLKLDFYRKGLKLAFEAGRLVSVDPWVPPDKERGDAIFPGQTFLQILFGYRSFGELDHAFADCWARNDTGRALVEALFPKKASNVWPVS